MTRTGWFACAALLLSLAVARPTTAAPNVTFQTGTGAWKKGGTLVPPDVAADGTATTSSIHANAGTVTGKITKTERSSASFKGTTDFAVAAAADLRIDSDIALFMEKSSFTYKYRLYRGRKPVAAVGGIKWKQSTPGQEVNFNWFQTFPQLAPGDYQVRFSYKIKRKKNGTWDQHSPNAKPFTVSVTELP